jgi:cyclase
MIRLIARLDVKSDNVIKGVRYEGLRKLGSPKVYASDYYKNGIDEIFLFDTVASLYGRNQLSNLIESVAKEIFVPLTVGGGIRTLEDARILFDHGADKVAINSAAFGNLGLISEIASAYGNQAVVGSIQAKRRGLDWECMYEQGREKSGTYIQDRIEQFIESGAGEILVTSIDNDGTMSGFDIQLAEIACSISTVPVAVGGGCGSAQDILQLSTIEKISGVSIGSALHYGKITVDEAKSTVRQTG